MEEADVIACWEGNAEAWTTLSRAGYDICRDGYNTPRFLEMLPDVAGLTGLDIGCGEGTNTRRVAAHGATMTGVDVAPTFIRHARDARDNPPGITFLLASATQLPFADAGFDFAVSFMCLMDFPGNREAIAEAWRVLKPGGFLQFSILHPCFVPPCCRKIKDAAKREVRVEVGRYFEHTDGEMEQWRFGAAPAELKAKYPAFRIPRFHRTLTWWLNTVIEAGFVVERTQEPRPTDEEVRRYPGLWDEQALPLFLHVRGRKGRAALRAGG